MQIDQAPSGKFQRNKPIPRNSRSPGERLWTVAEKHKLRGFIERGWPAAKIARMLRRPLVSVIGMAARLGVTLE